MGSKDNKRLFVEYGVYGVLFVEAGQYAAVKAGLDKDSDIRFAIERVRTKLIFEKLFGIDDEDVDVINMAGPVIEYSPRNEHYFISAAYLKELDHSSVDGMLYVDVGFKF